MQGGVFRNGHVWLYSIWQKTINILSKLLLGIQSILGYRIKDRDNKNEWIETCNAGNEVDDWEIPLALGGPDVDAVVQAPGEEAIIEFVLNREGSDFKDVFGIGPVCQSQSRSGRESEK